MSDKIVYKQKLLPCPFCGEKAQINRVGKPLFSIICSNIECGCEIEQNELGKAIRAWNNRIKQIN